MYICNCASTAKHGFECSSCSFERPAQCIQPDLSRHSYHLCRHTPEKTNHVHQSKDKTHLHKGHAGKLTLTTAYKDSRSSGLDLSVSVTLRSKGLLVCTQDSQCIITTSKHRSRQSWGPVKCSSWPAPWTAMNRSKQASNALVFSMMLNKSGNLTSQHEICSHELQLCNCNTCLLCITSH